MAEGCDGSSFVMSALPNRRRVAASDIIGYRMKELLQRLELGYCRSALLLGAPASADGRPHQKWHVQVSLTGVRGEVPCE